MKDDFLKYIVQSPTPRGQDDRRRDLKCQHDLLWYSKSTRNPHLSNKKHQNQEPSIVNPRDLLQNKHPLSYIREVINSPTIHLEA